MTFLAPFSTKVIAHRGTPMASAASRCLIPAFFLADFNAAPSSASFICLSAAREAKSAPEAPFEEMLEKKDGRLAAEPSAPSRLSVGPGRRRRETRHP